MGPEGNLEEFSSKGEASAGMQELSCADLQKYGKWRWKRSRNERITNWSQVILRQKLPVKFQLTSVTSH